MTFYLLKTGQYNYTTVMYVGTKVHFQLQIQFPPGTMDLLVELFTPDNSTTIMVICNPQIVWVGQNIYFDESKAQPVMDSLDGSLNVSNITFSELIYQKLLNRKLVMLFCLTIDHHIPD